MVVKSLQHQFTARLEWQLDVQRQIGHRNVHKRAPASGQLPRSSVTEFRES
jgi:hypothetical protein